MKRWTALFISFVVLFAPAFAEAMPLRPMQTIAGATGNDVSWPNCRESNAVSGQFGIVGVNGGKVFTGNKCLRQEADWFPNSTLALYANTANWGLPRGKNYTNFPLKCNANDELCVSYDFGYSTGKYAVMYAASQGVHSENWWLDVETVNSWTSNLVANRQALQGIADAIRHYTVFGTIGFYSTSLQWNQIVGNWQPNDAAWLAIGPGTAEEAAPYCKVPSFTAGKILFVQYTQTLDLDRVC
jgi:hypothetical protein